MLLLLTITSLVWLVRAGVASIVVGRWYVVAVTSSTVLVSLTMLVGMRASGEVAPSTKAITSLNVGVVITARRYAKQLRRLDVAVGCR
uniref:Uncharacterized protein n=1 Tax=Bacteriophage sp. TaxID=38018 RepID=A0A7G9A3X4_9VIRU|nr:MAG: hypothetical protein [Bacteriophage sp.]